MTIKIILTSAVTTVASINSDDKSDGFHSASHFMTGISLAILPFVTSARITRRSAINHAKKKKYTLFINYNQNNGGP